MDEVVHDLKQVFEFSDSGDLPTRAQHVCGISYTVTCTYVHTYLALQIL